MVSSSTSVDLSESQVGPLTVSIVVCTAIAGISVLLRLYTRWAIVGRVFPSDYCIVLGLLGSIGTAISIGTDIHDGFGRHTATVTQEDLMHQNKIGIAIMFFFHWCHMTVKTSILLQFLRICVMPIETRICYGAIFVVIAEGISWLVTLFLTCIPFKAMWIPHLPGAKCINNTAAFYACSVTTISADIFILLFPILVLRHSRLPWSRKLALGIVLGVGGSACIASILRVREIYRSTNSRDISWDKVRNAILGVIEVNLGIICSSISTLLPLVNRYVPDRWWNWIDGKQGERLTISGGVILDTTKPGSCSGSEGAERGRGRPGAPACEDGKAHRTGCMPV